MRDFDAAKFGASDCRIKMAMVLFGLIWCSTESGRTGNDWGFTVYEGVGARACDRGRQRLGMSPLSMFETELFAQVTSERIQIVKERRSSDSKMGKRLQ